MVTNFLYYLQGWIAYASLICTACLPILVQAECNTSVPISVSSAAQLINVLQSAQGCETILLAQGDYGDLVISGYPNLAHYNFPDFVTIRSADSNNRAIFRYISVTYASHIRFSDIIVHHPMQPGENDWSRAIDFSHSNYLEFVSSEIYGSDDNNFTNDIYGFYADGVDYLKFSNNNVHNFLRGTIIGNGNHLIVSNNHYHHLRSDGADFADLVDVLVENNLFSDFHPCCGDHPDMIQFWNDNGDRTMQDVVIRNNTMLRGSGDPTQSIFIQSNNAQFRNKNFLIENNVVYNGHSHGITIYDTDGVTIRHNTVLAYRLNPSELVASINTYNNTSTTVSDNVSTAYSNIGNDTLYINNITAQNGTTAPEKAANNHYDKLFVNANSVANAVRDDFLPRPESILIINPGSDIGALEYDSSPDNITALILADVTSGPAPLTVHLDGSLSGGPSPISTYDWNFGDGQLASSSAVDHTFFSPGTYNITLAITDELQQHDLTQKTIVVNPPPVSGLVLGLTFNKNLNDYSAHNMQTEWIGDEAYGQGTVESGLALNGTSNGGFVHIPYNQDLDGMSKLSFSFWAKKNNNTGGSILNKHISYSITLGSNSIGGYLFNQNGDRFDFGFTSSVINDVNWHHYSVVYDGSAIICYVDGLLIGNMSANGDVAIHQDRDIYIGKNPWGNSFDGNIDEFKMFNIALTAQQVTGLATPNAPPNVNAGPDIVATFSDAIQIQGTVSDDGLPIFQSTSTSWSKINGPGNAVILSQSSPSTSILVELPGEYTFRLTASDGEQSSSDDVIITVNPVLTPIATSTPTGLIKLLSKTFKGTLNKKNNSKLFNLTLSKSATLSCITTKTNNSSNLNVSVRNSKGKVIVSKSSSASNLAINNLSLSPGVYKFKFTAPKRKIVKFKSVIKYYQTN